MAKSKSSGISTGGGAQTGAGVAGGGVGASAGGGAKSSSLNLSDDDITKIKQISIIYGEYLKSGYLSEEQYKLSMQALADNFDTDVKTLIEIKNGKFDKKKDEPEKKKKKEPEKKQEPKAKKAEEKKASDVDTTGNLAELPGANGNPWPPNAGSNHIEWYNSKDIWDKMGGGYNKGGVGGQQAKDMFSAIKDYTDGPYEEIRDAYKKGQKKGIDSLSEYEKGLYAEAVSCESFINHGVKAGLEWKGGTTYRGVPFSQETYKKIMDTPVGEYVDPNWGAVASWSTSRSTAQSFAKPYSPSKESVVFVEVTGHHKGSVSIKNVSSYSSENEVLASGSTQYKKLGMYKEGKYTYVYVESEN